jgi:hypothetical protein
MLAGPAGAEVRLAVTSLLCLPRGASHTSTLQRVEVHAVAQPGQSWLAAAGAAAAHESPARTQL